MLGLLGRFGEREFEDITLAEPLQLFDFLVVVSDQAALDSEVADGTLKFTLSGFQVRFRGGNVSLCSADFRGHFSEFRRGVRLTCADLLAKLLAVLFLLLLQGLCEAAGTREFILSQAEFLRSYIELALEVRDAGVRLVEFGGKDLGLLVCGI